MAHRPVIDNAAKTARSKQNLSCNWTGSADFGRLVPIHWEELLEGDHILRFRPRIEMQMLPFSSPTFTKIDLYVHAFVVPLRQIHKNFYDLWSRVGDYKDSPLQYLTPRVFLHAYNNIFVDNIQHLKSAAYKHWTSLGLNPFFSLPYDASFDSSSPIWLAPFFAYNKIWWDFYRDPELLRDENKTEWLYDGDVNGVIPSEFQAQGEFETKFLLPHLRTIKNNWISDLFASGGQDFNSVDDIYNRTYPFNELSLLPYNNLDSEDETLFPATPSVIQPYYAQLNGETGMSEPLPNASALIRLQEALTRLSERLSLSGKRQIEALFARYGVKPKWSQMNLARYVGGAKASVLVSDIMQSAETAQLPLGAKAGNGYCALDDLNIECSVEEPSIFMCIASVMPHIHFVQGISKKFQRKQLVDMFQDSLQYVGNVAVAKKEVGYKYPNMTYTTGDDDATFAYSDPYYEYKMGLDILAGDFMKYHNVTLPEEDNDERKQIQYMQSMENYIDFPNNREFEYTNLWVDGDQFNKIFSYLGGSLWQGGDDHFHLCVDKEFIMERPMEGFAIPTLETTKDPHEKTTKLSQDKML